MKNTTAFLRIACAPRRVRATITALILFFTFRLLGQSPADPHRYDERIAFFQEAGQPDSVRRYAAATIRLARVADSLSVWVLAHLDVYDTYADDPVAALQCLDAAWMQLWRQPVTAAECAPLIYLQASRGWHLFHTGQVWQSVQAYDMARDWYERFQFPDFDAVEEIYKPLGNHLTRLGDNEKALAVFQKALLLSDDPGTLSGLYCNIGIAYWNAGDFPAAATAFRRGLQLPGLPPAQRALLLGGLAQTQLDEEQSLAAYESGMQAVRLLSAGFNLQNSKIKPPNAQSAELTALRSIRARAYRTAANACFQLNRLAEAERLLREASTDARLAFGVNDREFSKLENDRAKLYLRQSRPQLALEACNRALTAVLPAFRPKRSTENPLPNTFYEENAIFEALATKAEAAERQYQQSGELGWLLCAAECHDLAWKAETTLREVFQYHSSKLGLQSTARAREAAAMQIARVLFEKTNELQYLEKAFAIAERSKATLLLDALRDNLVRQRLADQDPRFAQLSALLQSRAFFEKSLLLAPQSPLVPQWRAEADALTTQIATLRRALAAAYPRLPGEDLKSSIASTSAVSSHLAEGETLLEYFVSQQFIDVFVVNKNAPPVWHRWPLDAQIQTMVSDFLSAFSNAQSILNDPAAYLQTAYSLYQKIVPPEAVSASKLLVVPDGFLNFIPFEALLDAAPNGQTTLRNASYLIRRHAVRYAWSSATLQQQNNLISQASRYLLGIAPVCSEGVRGLAVLPSSRAEWQVLSGGNVSELIGDQAVWPGIAAAAAQYRILHFSTHAYAGTSGEQLPRIELYDQPVFLPDIYALPLQADLVVLSACQTGLGTQQAGEGVMSLARAFAQAGSACVVSSLWTVNDRSTAQLFTRFYEKIETGASVSAALHQAKLDYLSDSNVPTAMQSPYFWAGLSVVGADRTVLPPDLYSRWWQFGIIATLLLIGWVLRRKLLRPKGFDPEIG